MTKTRSYSSDFSALPEQEQKLLQAIGATVVEHEQTLTYENLTAGSSLESSANQYRGGVKANNSTRLGVSHILRNGWSHRSHEPQRRNTALQIYYRSSHFRCTNLLCLLLTTIEKQSAANSYQQNWRD